MSASAAKPLNPLLAAYLAELVAHPLRTKALTTGSLSFLQEVLASHLAGTPVKQKPKDAPVYSHALARARIEAKSFKMFIYGFLVSAPMGHYLVGALQRVFAGKTGTGAKVAQVIASNLLVAPIQTLVYLASMAIINGAKSADEVKKTVKAGFMPVLRVTWVTSPLTLVFAQNFVAPELWVPFFNMVQFVLGTYFNTKVKKARSAAEARARRELEEKAKAGKSA
ncbi:hypothetical protein PUNSTDRAFT_110213 [Punctularia strigosozonata HHB-11173 SS5]|uniref:uncharacterized protein n=1 Tax=Punctularia strigosozonata (strain HHB-11173) TaxID=741275 RepID=UPI00044164EA|nr:uncharacterized protein PUNSTDRAFT_110213 [Punctularia strigosozonata HHB-11173 SS5]EIN14079.1 hypothetical protein PUNSTDRAFT_110213 [Punctularia strigosozonata HHB-11173 SS5]